MSGFKPLLTGTFGGTTYGKGTYFASSASFSDLYCLGQDGVAQRLGGPQPRRMLLAAVAVGRYCQGNPRM